MQMIQCPQCDASLPEHAKYCAYCGESITSPGHSAIQSQARNHQSVQVLDEPTQSALPKIKKIDHVVPQQIHIPHFYTIGSELRATSPNNFLRSSARPATINVRRARMGGFTHSHTLTQDPPGELAESVQDEHRQLTWHKEVSSEPMEVPHTPFPRPISQPRPILLKRKSRRPSVKLFFWASALVLFIFLLAGVFGVFVTFGRGPTKPSPQSTGPTLMITPNAVASGGMLTIRGSSFTPRGHIGLTRDGVLPLIDTGGTSIINTDIHGQFADTVIVSGDWGAGAHVINAEDAISHKLAKFSLIVSGQSTSLRPSHLHLSQNSIDLGTADQATNSTQILTLSNNGGGLINWQASATQPWLQLSPSKGTFVSGQQVQMIVAVDRSLLGPGPYTGLILITSNAGQQTVAVRLQVLPVVVARVAILQLTPAVLSFTGTDGGNAPNGQPIAISNPGTRPLQWSASSRDPWVTLSTSSGVVQPSEHANVNVSINTSTLLPGTYMSSIIFTGQNDATVQNGPQSIFISVTITPQCSLQIAPVTLSFASVYQQAGPAAKTVTIGTSQGCNSPMAWTATSTAPWLMASARSGNTPAHPTVSIVTTGLAPNTYTGSIVFSTTNSTQTLPVTLTIGQPTTPVMPNIFTAFNFTDVVGQPSPAAQQMSVANNGGGIMHWQAAATTSVGGQWLTVAPTAGSLAGGQTVPLTVTASMLPALTPGTYNGMITIIAVDDAGHKVAGSPQMITASFVVQAACSVAATPTALTFTTVPSQSAPAAQAVTIPATGACANALTWTATVATTPVGGNWLVATPATGTATLATAGSTSISIVPTGLAAGNYSGNITITTVNSTTHTAIGTAQTIPVTMKVLQPCTLQAPSTTTAAFTTESGLNPATQTFTMAISGACKGKVTVTPTITYGATGSGWLSVTPSTAAVPTGSSTTYTLAVTATHLAPGTYSASIALAGTNLGVAIAGSPQTFAVTLSVVAPAAMNVSPASLTINTTTGTSSTPLSLANSGGSALNWTATLGAGSPSFVSLSVAQGAHVIQNANTLVNVNVDATGVAGNQSYNASVTFSAIDTTTGKPAAGSPITIPVVINVAAPAMQMSTNTINFTTTAGINPAAQSIVISNTGGGTLQWTVGTPSASWLTVSPTSGKDNSGASSSLTFAANTAGLTAGTYSATVVVTPSTGSPFTVTVALTLNAAPTPTPTPPPPTPPPTPGTTPTANPNVMPTPTPTSVPTATPTPTPTPTATPTPTPTPTPDPTPTPTPTLTPTATPNPTATTTPSVTATPTHKQKHHHLFVGRMPRTFKAGRNANKLKA